MHAHQISMSPQPWMVSRTSVLPTLWHTNKHQLDRDDDGSCMLLDLPQTLPFNTTCSTCAHSCPTGTSMLPFVRKPAQRMEGVSAPQLQRRQSHSALRCAAQASIRQLWRRWMAGHEAGETGPRAPWCHCNVFSRSMRWYQRPLQKIFARLESAVRPCRRAPALRESAVLRWV